MRGQAGVERVSPVTRVCFVAPRAFGALSGDPRAGHVGGAEVQQALLARGLAGRGHAVSMVTLDVGQGDGGSFAGVQVLASHRAEDGLPGLRFVWPRITRTWAAMRRADALVYYQRTSDSLTGVVAAFCRSRQRRFVFAAGAAEDCLPSLPNCRTWRERTLYRYGLRRADVVLAQNSWQQESLARHFDRTSVIVRSAAPDPGEPTPPPSRVRPRLLWAGRLAAEKRPGLLVELARRCPAIDFDVVGAGEAAAEAAVAEASRQLENLHFHGYVPHAEMGPRYDRASGLVCTSVREGAPNTFLEAWSRGRPVLTTVDPGGVVAAEGIGIVAAGVDELVQGARSVTEARGPGPDMARRARDYYTREHRPARILDDYEAVLAGTGPREVSCSR